MGKRKDAAEAPPKEQQQQQQPNGGRKPPVHECRIGRIRGVVWENDSKDGKWFSVNITRSYKDGENNWKQATSFGRDDLLVVAEVSRLCFLFIAQAAGSKLDGNGHAGEQTTNGDVPF